MELDSRQVAILEARTKLERDLNRLQEALEIDDYEYALEITKEMIDLLRFLSRQYKEESWASQQ